MAPITFHKVLGILINTTKQNKHNPSRIEQPIFLQEQN